MGEVKVDISETVDTRCSLNLVCWLVRFLSLLGESGRWISESSSWGSGRLSRRFVHLCEIKINLVPKRPVLAYHSSRDDKHSWRFISPSKLKRPPGFVIPSSASFLAFAHFPILLFGRAAFDWLDANIHSPLPPPLSQWILPLPFQSVPWYYTISVGCIRASTDVRSSFHQSRTWARALTLFKSPLHRTRYPSHHHHHRASYLHDHGHN